MSRDRYPSGMSEGERKQEADSRSGKETGNRKQGTASGKMFLSS
jgi:hypothetical protein